MNSNNNIDSNKPIIKNEFTSKHNNNISIFSLVCGIMSLIVFWALIYPIILGILGFIFGIIGIISTHQKTSFSVIGLVTSLLGSCIGIIVLILELIL